MCIYTNASNNDGVKLEIEKSTDTEREREQEKSCGDDERENRIVYKRI